MGECLSIYGSSYKLFMSGTKIIFGYDCNIALLAVVLWLDDAIKHGLVEVEHFNALDGEIIFNITGDDSMIG